MTDRGDRIAKKLYLREHSNILRKRRNVTGLHSLKEDEQASLNDGLARFIIVMICRNKQRLCQQAWNKWTKNANVIHDYTKDLRSILLRKIPDDQPRTELEIEILCKWAYQIGNKDPTGIAFAISNCKSKQAIINLFQHCRLECFSPNQTILFQGSLPRIEDGHFTVIQGEVEILGVEDGSVKLLQLQNFAKDQKWEAAKHLLSNVKSLATISFPGGFGELATLSHASRTASVRAGGYGITEVLVVPKKELLDCLGRGNSGGDAGKAIDFLRQTGLASRISPKDLLIAANSMKKHTFLKGDILFLKGEPVKSLYLVVSGDILLDVNDCDVQKHQIPFLNPEINNYYNLSGGSVLGDEGLSGQDNRYESSAVVVSNAAVIFEATGFSFTFLAESIGAIRYCALAYKELPRLSPAITRAEEVNVYSNFNTLRKCIAYAKPQRGKLPKSTLEDVINTAKIDTDVIDHKKNKNKKRVNQNSSKKIVSKIAAENRRLALESLANSGIKKRNSEGTEEIRTLAAVPMHHALNIYRTAKKRATELVKIFARDNILNGELEHDVKQPTLTLRSVNDNESKLKSAISKYHDRMKENLSQLGEDIEDGDLQLAEVHNIQSLLGSMAASAAIQEENDDEGDYVAHRRQSSIYFLDENPFLEIQVLGPEYGVISRISQYYSYLDYMRREGREVYDHSLINTRPGSFDANISSANKNDDDGSQSTLNVVKKVSEKRGIDPLRISIEPWRPPSPSSKPHHELLAETFSRPLSPYRTGSPHDTKPRILTAESLKDATTRPTTSNTAISKFLDDKEQNTQKDNKVSDDNGPKFWRLPAPKIRHQLQLDSSGNFVNHGATFIRTNINDTGIADVTKGMTNSMMDAIETSEEFWKAINAKEFPIRKSHRPKHLWVTRAVKVGPFAKNEDFIGSEEWADKLFGKYIDTTDTKLKKRNSHNPEQLENNINDKIVNHPDINEENNDISINEDNKDIASDEKSENIEINDTHDQQNNEIEDEKEDIGNDITNNNDNDDDKTLPSNELSPRKNSLTSITSSEEIADNKTKGVGEQLVQGNNLKKNINAVKKWPDNLAMSDPSSDAMDKYNDLIRTDISSRKFLDGKKKSALNSKFILPRKISSAREIEYGSSAEDMSMALLSCLLPEETTDSSIKDTIKKQREEFLKPQLQFNTILVSTDNLLQTVSMKKTIDKTINNWQQMTVDRVIDHQLGPKYTLPVLYKGKDGTINRTKRFAGSLEMLPPAKNEYILDGPTSFLELYKNNPKKTYRY